MKEAFKTQLSKWLGISVHSLRKIVNSEGGPNLTQDKVQAVAKKFGLDPVCVDQFEGTIDMGAFTESLVSPLSDRATRLLNKI